MYKNVLMLSLLVSISTVSVCGGDKTPQFPDPRNLTQPFSYTGGTPQTSSITPTSLTFKERAFGLGESIAKCGVTVCAAEWVAHNALQTSVATGASAVGTAACNLGKSMWFVNGAIKGADKAITFASSYTSPLFNTITTTQVAGYSLKGASAWACAHPGTLYAGYVLINTIKDYIQFAKAARNTQSTKKFDQYKKALAQHTIINSLVGSNTLVTLIGFGCYRSYKNAAAPWLNGFHMVRNGFHVLIDSFKDVEETKAD